MVGVLFGRWSVLDLPFGRWSVVNFWFGRWSVVFMVGVRFVSPFSKKRHFQNGQKSRENRTNIDMILLFLRSHWRNMVSHWCMSLIRSCVPLVVTRN